MCDVHAHSSGEVLGVTTGLAPGDLQFAVLVTLAVAFSAVMLYIEMRRAGGDD